MVKKSVGVCMAVILAVSACAHDPETILDTYRPLESYRPNVTTVGEAVAWIESHFYYRNVSGWDPAPDLRQVYADGFGDCKMLAGVSSDLLAHVGQANTIVTILRDGTYHMFVIYAEPDGRLRVFENAKLRTTIYDDEQSILKDFGVRAFVARHDSYEAFRAWFNNEVYRR